ncbi:MAG: glycosyltransferase 87 family protein [Chloroflexota bacterium]|nr:glycosyltransferase 87 family protein [Chloroflexota bacterium]
MLASAGWRALQDYPTRLFDLYPLYYGGIAWLKTGTAYVLDSVVPIGDHSYLVYQVGNIYPLPAVIVTLPLTLLPPQIAGTLWIALLVGGLIGSLRLYGGSYWFLLYLPLLEAVRIEQYTALIVIFQIVALWAVRERRPWILALCCAIILTKPSHGLAFVIAVALLSGHWRRILLVSGLLWGASLAADPSWPVEWASALVQDGRFEAGGFMWPIAAFAVPLTIVADVVGAAVVLQFLLLPLFGVYVATSVPLSLLHDPRIRWLVALSFLWPFPAALLSPAWATVLTLVLPMVVLSAYIRRDRLSRFRYRAAARA